MTIKSTYRIAGMPGVQRILAEHYWRKDAKRIPNGAYITSYNTSSLTVGTHGEMSIMLHFRLETCYGGHATTQAIARKMDGGNVTSGKGWSFYHDVATGELVVYLSDGTNTGELRASIDQEVLSVWVVTYDPYTSDEALLYKDGVEVDSLSLAGWSDANDNTSDIKFGDATYGVSMMLGGFMVTSDVLSEGEVARLNDEKDSDWDDDIDNQIIHLAGEGFDQWTGLGADVNDIDLDNNRWKDVTGNGHYSSNSSSSILNQKATGRLWSADLGHTFESLSVAMTGSNATIIVSWDSEVTVGTVVHIKGQANAWTGVVDSVEKGQKGKTLKCIGFDEGSDTTVSEEYSSHTSQGSTTHSDESDGVYNDEAESTDSGSFRMRGDRGLALYDYSLLKGGMAGTKPGGPFQGGILYRTPLLLNEKAYALLEVKETIKDSASHVLVYFDTGVDVPKSESFVISTSTSTFTLSEQPTSIVEVTANGIVKEKGDYKFNPDKKTLTFDTALVSANSPLVVKYQVKDMVIGEASDPELIWEIGGEKTREIHLTGRPTQVEADAIAEEYLHGPFHNLSIFPLAKYCAGINWFVGRGIQISNGTDKQGINGNYKISKITWEGSIDAQPKLELEETLTKFMLVDDLSKLWWRRNLRDSRSTYGF